MSLCEGGKTSLTACLWKGCPVLSPFLILFLSASWLLWAEQFHHILLLLWCFVMTQENEDSPLWIGSYETVSLKMPFLSKSTFLWNFVTAIKSWLMEMCTLNLLYQNYYLWLFDWNVIIPSFSLILCWEPNSCLVVGKLQSTPKVFKTHWFFTVFFRKNNLYLF